MIHTRQSSADSFLHITKEMEELTVNELQGILENPNTSREDLVLAATQLGRREGRAEGLAERQLLQHLLTMSSDKSAIIRG